MRKPIDHRPPEPGRRLVPIISAHSQACVSHGAFAHFSQPRGKTTFVIDEYYASPAGIARHWQETPSWSEMSSGAAPAWIAKATVTTLHHGTVVQALS